jgi:hypothetical protein
MNFLKIRYLESNIFFNSLIDIQKQVGRHFRFYSPNKAEPVDTFF